MREPPETTVRKRPESPAPDPDELLVQPRIDNIHRSGRVLVSHFYMVVKTAGMFDFSNVITQEAVVTFLDTLRGILESDSEIRLTMASDCLFVNETRLKIDFEGFTSFKFVIEALKERDIGTVVFRPGVDEEAVKVFLGVFIANDGRIEEPRKQIEVGLRAAGVDSISVEEIRDLAEELVTTDVPEDHREVSINTYFKSIFIAKQFIENFRGARASNFRKAKRLVHSIVDLVAQDETTLLAMTQIKNFDHFLFTHSANVCVLSVAVGQNLGLGKTLLGNLGLAALLHDVGLTEMPRELLTRKETLTKEERRLYEQHPAIGARAILRSQGLSEASIRCILAAYEHHVHDDATGFPEGGTRVERTLLGRIISIVDFYDAITTPDAESGTFFIPEEALRLMSNEGRGIFDSGLVKILVNTIGTYPLGTVVKLDTGETGIVHRKNPHFSQISRPLVKIIADATGLPVPHTMVDLNDWDAEAERYRRTIVETIAPSEYFEETREFTAAV